MLSRTSVHPLRLLPLALAALVAWGAQAQPADDLEAARASARKGQSLYELARYPEALEAFEAAYQKKPVPALLFNIAQCHRQLGHLEQAARVYRSYLRSDPPEAAAKQARELLATVEDAVSRQAQAMESPPHDLRDASAKLPAPQAAVSATPRPPAPPQHHRWPALAAGGVAATSLALGVVWALGSRSAAGDLRALHQAGPVDPARDAALRDEATSKNSRSRIAYVAAGIAAAAGVGLYFAF